MNNLSIRSKLLVLTASFLIIFIVSLFIIKGINTRIANNFDRFYQDNFSVSLQLERLKEAQVDIMVDVRGLQIAFLLNLENQIPGYLENMQRNYTETPPMLERLQLGFSHDPALHSELSNYVMTFQTNTQAFVQAMTDAPDNRAPFPVFSAFSQSFTEMISFFEELKTRTDQAAIQSQIEAEEAINFANSMFYISLALVIIITLAMSYFISSNIINGIAHIKELAVKLSQGNLAIRSKVEGRDEVASLGQSLNETMDNLSRIIKEISGSAQVVEKNSERVLNANESVKSMSIDITDNIHQVVTAIEEMSATSKTIAHNTTETASAAGQMENMVNQGMSASSHTIETVQKMMTSLQDTAGVVTNLQQEMISIEKILDVIRAISEQTNLLALNAAIEAARAGDQGRGFAVVADEVRSLAQRSQGSVDEIETLLKHLKTIGDDAVSRMRQSTDMATMSREHINKNNEMLQSILDAVEHVSAQSQQIAAAAEEQSAVALEISHKMHSVQSLTQQSADTVIETGNFSEEMHQVSQQVMGQLDFFKLSKEKL